MRHGLRALLAVAFAAGAAACGGDGEDVELYEGEEAATPSLETQPVGGDAAIITAQFEPAQGATESAQISGTVRIFPADGAGMTGTTGATTTTPATETDATTTDPNAATSAQAQSGQGFRVEVTLNGLSQGEHAWHIHSAPCGQQAPVVVAFTPTADQQGLAQPLTADQTGATQGQATVPADQLTLDQLQSGQYSLHVHTQGGVDHGPTVACANLQGQGATTM